MADVLTDSQIGEIMAAFNAVDADNDGIIGANQLGMVLKLLGENPTDAVLQVLLRARLHYVTKPCDIGHRTV